MNIKTVTVVGANGTMGSNVAGIWASFGGAHVYMISRTKEKSEEAIKRAAKSVRADAIKQNMEAKDYSDLAEWSGYILHPHRLPTAADVLRPYTRYLS